MTQPLFFEKHLGGLRPLGARAEEALAKIPHGAEIQVTLRRPRNIRHHRKWWALVNLVFENQEHYDNLDNMVVALKVALGHCETVILKDGKTAFIPRSIAFHNMDQAAFEEFYDRTVRLVVARFLPGVKDNELRREVEELVA